MSSWEPVHIGNERKPTRVTSCWARCVWVAVASILGMTALAVWGFYSGWNNISREYIIIDSDRVGAPIRLGLLADLHVGHHPDDPATARALRDSISIGMFGMTAAEVHARDPTFWARAGWSSCEECGPGSVAATQGKEQATAPPTVAPRKPPIPSVDVMLVAGDLLHFSHERATEVCELLAPLTLLRYGGLVVFGNHDFYDGSSRNALGDCLRERGLIMVDDRAVVLDAQRGVVQGNRTSEVLRAIPEPLAGHDGIPINHRPVIVSGWGSSGANGVKRATRAALNPTIDCFSVLLAHNPDKSGTLLMNDREGLYDLVLSGHTHGGQLCFPGWLSWFMGLGYPWNAYESIQGYAPDSPGKPRLSRQNAGFFASSVPRPVPLLRFSQWLSQWMPEALARRLPGAVIRHWEWASGLNVFPDASGSGQPRFLYASRGVKDLYLRVFCPPEVTFITVKPRSDL